MNDVNNHPNQKDRLIAILLVVILDLIFMIGGFILGFKIKTKH